MAYPKLPQGGKCKGTIRKHAGKLQAVTDCTIPANILKGTVPTKAHKAVRKSIPSAVRAECKGTRGKERTGCVKVAKLKIKMAKHTEEVSKYEDLGKDVPARVYEKGEKLQARYNIANELYEID